MRFEDHIRTLPDHPKPGILFRDVTTLMGDAKAFAAAIEALAEKPAHLSLTHVAGMEARGFIFGGALAVRLGLGFIPLRKPGKLPWRTKFVDYELEYGLDQLHMHEDACGEKDRVLVVDDLIATGGTAVAAVELIRANGALVDHAAFVVDLPELGGAKRLEKLGVTPISLCAFDGH